MADLSEKDPESQIPTDRQLVEKVEESPAEADDNAVPTDAKLVTEGDNEGEGEANEEVINDDGLVVNVINLPMPIDEDELQEAKDLIEEGNKI